MRLINWIIDTTRKPELYRQTRPAPYIPMALPCGCYAIEGYQLVVYKNKVVKRCPRCHRRFITVKIMKDKVYGLPYEYIKKSHWDDDMPDTITHNYFDGLDTEEQANILFRISGGDKDLYNPIDDKFLMNLIHF